MDKDIRQKILSDYPYPIAVYYKKMLVEERLLNRKKGSKQTLFHSLLDLFEIINRFLTITAISQYIKDGPNCEKLNQLFKSKLQKNMSLGDWQELLRETIRNFQLEEEDSIGLKSELYQFYYKKTGRKAKYRTIVDRFNEMINIRNKKKGHTLNLTPREYDQLYAENYPYVMEILDEISFLSGYTLISPIEKDSNIFMEYLMMKGTNVIECFEPLTVQMDSLEEGEILLYSEKEQLKLSPLSFYDLDYEADMEQYLWLYEGNKMVENSLKSLTYLGFTPAPKNKIQSIDHGSVEKQMLLNQFIELISFFFKEELATIAFDRELKLSPEDYYFHSQRALIDYYRATFFGRETETEAIELFLKKHSSGYYLIKGVPGQGKTAVMANLIYKHQFPHHFTSRNEGRNDEEAIVKSLSVQISKLIGKEVKGFPANIQDLKRSFHNLIQSYSDYCEERKIKGVIVLDGIDELKNIDDPNALDFLPFYLPMNIYVILSSRSVEGLSLIEERINEFMELGELDFKTIKTIVENRIDGISYETIRELYSGSNGNPLLLKCMIDQYIQRGSIQNLTTIESVFEKLMLELRKLEDPLSLHLIGVLITAGEALSIYQLGKILERPKYKVFKALQPISQFLIRTGNQYQPFHKKFVEYLTNQREELSFDKDELNLFHSLLVNYCEEKGEHHEYAQNFLIYHLYELGEYEQIAALLEKEGYHLSMIEVIKDEILQSSNDSTRLKKMQTFISSITDKGDKEVEVLLMAFDKVLHVGGYNIVLQFLLFLQKKPGLDQSNREKLTYLTARVYRERGDLHKAQDLLESLERSQNLSFNKNEKLNLFLELGNLMREQGERGRAINYYDLALKYCDKEKEINQYLDIYYHVCDMVYVQGKFKQALEDLNEAIEVAKQHDLTLNIGKLLRIKGQVFYVLDLYDDALSCYHEGLECFLAVNDPIQLGKMYNNISEAYVYSDIDKATSFNKASFDLNQINDKKIEVGKAEMIRGMIERERGNIQEAIKWCGKSVTTLTEVGYKSGIGKALYQKAVVYLKDGQWEKALEISRNSNDYFLKRKTAGYQIFIIKNYYVQNTALLMIGEKAEEATIATEIFPEMHCFESVADVYHRIKSNIEASLRGINITK